MSQIKLNLNLLPSMQSLSWYFQRLKTMSSEEIFWRIRSIYTECVHTHKVDKGIVPSINDAISTDERDQWCPSFRISDLPIGAWCSGLETPVERRWCEQLLAMAKILTQRKLSYFNLYQYFHGDPIQWNKDHGNNIESPIIPTQKIDYRDARVVGDCKLVWEPNRHQHFVVLGRAYRATGDRQFPEHIRTQLESWFEQCPYGFGMNWRSPMELAIRLINWVWSIDLTWESGIFSGIFRDKVLHSIYLHLYEVTRKYSRGTSANNHLIGEAGGVFVATSYFPQLRNAKRWNEESYDILCREIELQTFEDGCNKEMALEYQFFVLQFFIICGLVGKWSGSEFPQTYWNNLERQLLYIGFLQEGGGSPVFYGDADDGYVLNLGDSHNDPRHLLGAGALLFNNPQFKVWAPQYSESIRWLFGKSGEKQFAVINAVQTSNRLTSHAFTESGVYLLQSGHYNSNDRISVFFDCGPLGFGPIAAHGHADALSFTLKAFNEDILIDPGTYDYFTYPDWRKYFKSTIAHNTIEVDGVDQSLILGLFLWGKRANATCLEWQPNNNGGIVAGQHDGYSRLTDPVIHRRKIQLKGDERVLLIADEIICQGRHILRIPFHFGPICQLKEIDSMLFQFTTQNGSGHIQMDERLSTTLFTGCLQPPLGWNSDGYHKKQPSPTLIASAEIQGNTALTFKISLN